MAEQFADQLIAERQVRLHRQWPGIGFGIKRGSHKCFVDRRNERPPDFTAGQLHLRITRLQRRQEHLGQAPRVGTLTPWAGMNSKNSTHLNLLKG
ncbi:hypothetical protein D3C84_813920 [compost metagenome]